MLHSISSSDKESSQQEEKQSIWEMAKKMISLELLMEPRFLLIGFSTFFSMLGFYVPYVYLINMATISKGMKEEDASFLISIIGD